MENLPKRMRPVLQMYLRKVGTGFPFLCACQEAPFDPYELTEGGGDNHTAAVGVENALTPQPWEIKAQAFDVLACQRN